MPSPGKKPHPAPLRTLPFFYGWVVLGVVMVSGFLGAGLNNIAMGVVFKPISEDLGWSRSLTAGGVAAGTIGAGLLAPFLGRVADRLGPRLLLPGGAVVVGALTLALSRVTEPWQFYAAYVPARALGQTLLFGVVPVTAVANWFQRRRPRAMGLLAMSIPFGASTLALGYQVLIGRFGWRAAFVALGALLWIALVVPGALLLRRRPEDVGLAPDGLPPAAAEAPMRGATRAAHMEHRWTFAEASRTAALWLLAVSSVLYTTASGGVAFHLAAYLTDVGLEPLVAAAALSTFGYAGGIAAGAWGFLAERVSPRALNVGSMLLSAAGVALLLQVREAPLAFAFAVVFGVTSRGQEALLQILLAHYYGRHSFGAISGVQEFALRLGLGLGPILGAAAFDLSGGYQGVLLLFTAFYVVSAGLIFLARRPEPSGRRQRAQP